jgi:hypothetical protein
VLRLSLHHFAGDSDIRKALIGNEKIFSELLPYAPERLPNCDAPPKFRGIQKSRNWTKTDRIDRLFKANVTLGVDGQEPDSRVDDFHPSAGELELFVRVEEVARCSRRSPMFCRLKSGLIFGVSAPHPAEQHQSWGIFERRDFRESV